LCQINIIHYQSKYTYISTWYLIYIQSNFFQAIANLREIRESEQARSR